MLENKPTTLGVTMSLVDPIRSNLLDIDILRQVSSLLAWDQETYMPSDAIHARANQLAWVSGAMHDQWQSPVLRDWMRTHTTQGVPNADLNDEDTAIVRELYAAWRQKTGVTKAVSQALAKTTATAQHVWADARSTEDFSLFAPHLQQVLDVTRQKIDQLGWCHHPYNTLLDEFEPGMTVETLDTILTPLKTMTIDYLRQSASSPPTSIDAVCDHDQQYRYSQELMTQVGYNTSRGRLDISTHPFTIDIHPTDVRITTRVDPNNLLESISSTLHELGHGLYEQGLDPEWAYTPYGQARSMAVHESQSRLWEVFIGQSRAFWRGQIHRIHDWFPTTTAYGPDDFHNVARRISPHWCRVASDPVTYNLHIIIRYECEKALISGTLRVDELPEFWNQAMHDYLGITITNDAQGVLQDVHWSAGLFGYFPSYTLGTLMATGLFYRLNEVFPSLQGMIQDRQFAPITQWLNHHIHRHGSRYTTHELLMRCGVEFNPTQFLDWAIGQ